MPSGGITITPGYQLGAGERVNNAKLNQLGQPVGQVNPDSITNVELSQDVTDILTSVGSNVRGDENLLCNGDMALWAGEEAGFALVSTGVKTGGRKHDISGCSNWFCANDANRTTSKVAFDQGQTEVPDGLKFFCRWVQSAPIDVSISPAYWSQRIEDVRQFAGRTISLSIWVRPTNDLTVVPSFRQFFGTGGSLDVVVLADPIALPRNVWTEVKATFNLPSIAGKVITDAYSYTGNTWPSFTEFRIQVPTDRVFQIDFAHAMAAIGTKVTAWEYRTPGQDYMLSARYVQVLGFSLASSIAAFAPFVNLKVPMVAQPANTQNVLLPVTGTGGLISAMTGYLYAVIQSNPHSVPSAAVVILNGHLHAPA